MIMTHYGIAEILIMCVVGLGGLAIPVAIIVFLVTIYKRLSAIEEMLKIKKP